jgi:hypothetical protein
MAHYSMSKKNTNRHEFVFKYSGFYLDQWFQLLYICTP